MVASDTPPQHLGDFGDSGHPPALLLTDRVQTGAFVSLESSIPSRPSPKPSPTSLFPTNFSTFLKNRGEDATILCDCVWRVGGGYLDGLFVFKAPSR